MDGLHDYYCTAAVTCPKLLLLVDNALLLLFPVVSAPGNIYISLITYTACAYVIIGMFRK